MFVANGHILSKVYRLIEPGVFEEVNMSHQVQNWEVVVEPILGSICHADLRYFSGDRRPEALKEKLPMALIHEGIGKVVKSNSERLPLGTRVVIVPNIPGYSMEGEEADNCCPICQQENGSNYCAHRIFLGSGYDGLTQSRIAMPSSCVIPIPNEVPDEIAVLTELCTVSYQALLSIKEKLQSATVAVFGDGPVGYITATMLKYIYGLNEDRLTVFGADPEKLKHFEFAKCFNVLSYHFAEGNRYDIAIDCTGGKFSESAINQAIDILNPLSEIILMGVSEEKVPINTRDVLEKGISLKGSSRSSVSDYPPVLEAMRNPSYQKVLSELLPRKKTAIRSVEDLKNVMDYAIRKRTWEKILLEFHW